jgi:hypothetical protein
MSDGYSAFIKIIMEIITRMDEKSGRYSDYTLPGIVVIDEIETHLHVEMQ